MKKTNLKIITLALGVLGSGAVIAQEGLNVDADGDVGIGLIEAASPLHIFRDDDTRDFVRLVSAFEATQDRPMMLLQNEGGIRFQFDNQAIGTSWRFQAATQGADTFEVTKVGTGAIEMRVDQAGNMTLRGTLTEGSDVNSKRDIEQIEQATVLDQVLALPISEWSYKDSPDERHVGPMAQDFHAAFGLGADDRHISARDMAGVSFAAIQALKTELDSKTAEVEGLRAELQAQNSHALALEERLELLETLISNAMTDGEVAAR
jgi:hypothetical protein